MAGLEHKTYSRHSQYGARVRSAAQGIGILSALAWAVGCADLDPGSETFCRVNPEVGPCATEGVPNPDNPWWCLGQEPEALSPARAGQIVAFLQPVVEWNT